MSLDSESGQPQNPRSVFFVSRYFYPFVGGLENRVFRIACALATRGIKVTIITSGIFPEFPPEQTFDNVSIYRLASPRTKIFGACIFIARLARFLIRKRAQYQALHTFQVGHTSAATVCVGRLLRKPVYLHLSGGGRGGDIGRHLRTPWGWIFLALSRFASTIVVLNKQMQRELQVLLYPAARSVCIPNGVDTDFYQPHQNRIQLKKSTGLPEAPIILYTGRLSAEKGLAVLIQAFALLKNSLAPALYILGNGPEQHRLELLIHKLHLDNRVSLLPARTEIRAYYQCADIFVMPSFHEGISNSILEAMACALPVVATDVTGNTDLIRNRDNGLLVPANDAPALAAALDELLSSPDNAREMGRRGQRIAQQNFCLDIMMDRYCALYTRPCS